MKWILVLEIANILTVGQLIAAYNKYPVDNVALLVQGLSILLVLILCYYVHLKTFEIFSILDNRITQTTVNVALYTGLGAFILIMGSFLFLMITSDQVLEPVDISNLGIFVLVILTVDTQMFYIAYMIYSHIKALTESTANRIYLLIFSLIGVVGLDAIVYYLYYTAKHAPPSIASVQQYHISYALVSIHSSILSVLFYQFKGLALRKRRNIETVSNNGVVTVKEWSVKDEQKENASNSSNPQTESKKSPLVALLQQATTKPETSTKLELGLLGDSFNVHSPTVDKLQG
ncbi:hypothetical protein HDV06_006583 [Boothiomyces sp. JEL0866]|nr:hypothetical protein HDV06_006583 [Boothiomyces sp. JEL0866]